MADAEEGLVVRYDYLWAREFDRGRNTSKDRPACVMFVGAAVPERAGQRRVFIAPITHAAPDADVAALELPPLEKRRLGLDDAPSWLLLCEVNTDVWPDGIVSASGAKGGVYGRLSYPLFRRAALRLAAEIRSGRVRTVPRS